MNLRAMVKQISNFRIMKKQINPINKNQLLNKQSANSISQNSKFHHPLMSEQTVKVIIRSRPFSEKQSSKNLPEYLNFDLKQKQLLITDVNGDKRKNKIFSFDDVFDAESNQEQIYQSVGMKLVDDVIQGYNGTIFAYGQTGSGKTHTMMGNLKSQEDRGVIPRCFKEILLKAKSSPEKQFLVLCSFIELYNEELRDLLNFNQKSKLEMRESPEQGIFIKDLKKFTITSEDEFQKYLKQGTQNRKTGQTLMNMESSRSHAIFTIYVESLEKNQKQSKLIGSKFNFVDLAGSERQSKTGSIGDRFVEATKINLSLTALGKVISALVEGKGSHIPYRDSKLTRLLQDSLGGNSKTVMIATISPSYYNFDESMSTLKYASRAKYITNVPIINRDPKDALLLQYQNQIKRLRTQLKEIQNFADVQELDQIKQENRRIAKQHQKQKSQLMAKINNLQKQLISSSPQVSKSYMEQRQKRQQKLTFMEQNYKNLQEQVKQMRGLLSELRRKYKNASKEIFQLQIEHQKQRQVLEEQCNDLVTENKMFKGVLNVLFTQKQLKNILSLGTWEGEKFKLPTFYFKDRNTLAFPCDTKTEDGPVSRTQKQNRENSQDKNCQTMTSLGIKAAINSGNNPYAQQQNSQFKGKKKN